MSRELADLLEHVKPPTLSKDEIDKSGLEIIEAAQLSQHENDGKASLNCLDRVCFPLSIENVDVFVDHNNFFRQCLICLDDYQPEEDIWVMSCRHALHQTFR